MTRGPAIELDDLHRTFVTTSGLVPAVRSMALKVAHGSFVTLLGPSGCGKSTSLRMIAGLERPDGGTIDIDGRRVFSADDKVDLPAHRRDIGMVFQTYAVWPHMTVFENAAYPLRVRGVERRLIRERVERMLDLVGLGGLGKRRSTQLSGGQQQRVALARALVAEPRVLLLDEPFSGLDAQLRVQMGEELKDLQRRIGVTTVYVTHDQHEALSLSDELVVMNGGSVVQKGAPAQVYRRPRTRFAAEFLGRTNLVPARIPAPLGAGQHDVDTSIGSVRVDVTGPSLPAARDVLVSIRPESLVASPLAEDDIASSNGRNLWIGRVERTTFRGEAVDYEVRVREHLLRVRSIGSPSISDGARVRLEVDPEQCVLVCDDALSDGGSPTLSPDGAAAGPGESGTGP